MRDRRTRQPRRAGMPSPALVPALVPALLAVGGLLAACGGEAEVGPKPDLPTETPALWNPCDALDTDFVAARFGSTTTEDAGSPTSPQCRFTPAADSGDAVLTANYLLFPGSLSDAWETMGQQADADVRTPAIEGADEARIVVNATRAQLYVTGFVQNGDLIQQVDVVDPRPYDEAQVVAGVRATLTRLSAHAVTSSVPEESAG